MAFLAEVVASQPEGKETHIILDNLSAHKTPLVNKFLEEHKNVALHFTPTHFSCLNQVEIRFSRLERDVIARGIFTSVSDLRRKTMRYIRLYGKTANPFDGNTPPQATSVDDFVYAPDATTGRLAWESRIVDYREDSAQETSGPIIANGKIVSGRCCEYKATPNGCVITAHDAKTGKELWRTRTIPKPGEPGNETWGDIPDANRRHVGTWMAPSFDPQLNLIYIGDSVTSPAPKFTLAGNDKRYLYHNSTLALNNDTGKIVWFYQHVVDHWDFDHPFERLLIDTAVNPDKSLVSWINPRLKPGEQRKVVTGIPGKTGIVYTLDRQTGEFLWATPTVRQNVVANIDGATGKVTVNPETVFNKVNDERFVCPTTNGGKDFPAGAYSPLTRSMYYPLQNTCSNVTALPDKPFTTSLYVIPNKNQIASGTDKIGTVQAISVETGRITWKYAARAHDVARGHGRGADLRRRHQRPLHGLRSGDREGLVAGKPRFACYPAIPSLTPRTGNSTSPVPAAHWPVPG